MFINKLLNTARQKAPSLARANQFRFFQSNSKPLPSRILPSLIFAENHTDPVLGSVLTRLIPYLKAMSYQQFLDEKGKEITLQDSLNSNEEDKLHYQYLKWQFSLCGLNITNPTDISKYASHHSINENELQHLRLFIRGKISFAMFYKALEKAQFQYLGVDLSHFTLEQACSLPILHIVRDKHIARHYLNHLNNCFGRVGLLHVEGIQDHIIASRPGIEAKNEYMFFYISSNAAHKRQGYEKLVHNNHIEFPLGLHVLDARNKNLNVLTHNIACMIKQQIKINAQDHNMPLPSHYLAH